MNHVKSKYIYLFFVITVLTTLVILGCSSRPNEASVPQKPTINEEIQNQEPREEQEPIEKESDKDVSPPEADNPLESGNDPLESLEPTQPLPPASLSPALKSPIPILYYHSIDYEEGNELRVPPEEFEAHMEHLSQNGYESVTLDDLYQYFYAGKDLPEKAFVLTFDDGYEDNYIHAFPIAEKYGYSGTVFIVTEWIGGKGYLNRQQLLEMNQAGWQIESHTVTHPYLDSISTEQIKEELLTSKEVLEELLGKPKVAFAYPYGVYDSSIIELCRETGYKMGLTIDRGWAGPEDPFRMKRVYCYAQMGLDEFRRRVENANY